MEGEGGPSRDSPCGEVGALHHFHGGGELDGLVPRDFSELGLDLEEAQVLGFLATRLAGAQEPRTRSGRAAAGDDRRAHVVDKGDAAA